jgi:hypothetical protein
MRSLDAPPVEVVRLIREESPSRGLRIDLEARPQLSVDHGMSAGAGSRP